MPRRPPHFKLFTTIAHHWKTAAFWSDPVLRATYIELGRIAIEKYADRTGDAFLVNSGELMFATGCKTTSAAVKRCEKLARLCRESVEQGSPMEGGRQRVTAGSPEGHPAVTFKSAGSGWMVTMPNLAKKQFSRPGNGTSTGPPSTTTSTSTTKDPPIPPRKRGGSGARRSAPRPPDWALDLSQRLRVLVAEHVPGANVPRKPDEWAKAIARIEDDPERIAAAVEWLYGPNLERDFKFVVQSGKSLREKYGRICEAMRQPDLTTGRPQNRAEQIAEDTKAAARRVLAGAMEKSRGRDGEGPAPGGPDGNVLRLRPAGRG